MRAGALLLLACLGLVPLAGGGAAAGEPVCLAAEDGCRVALDGTRERELRRVHAVVNAMIRPMSDLAAHGVAERWQPVDGRAGGDCDDYALTKLYRLVELGWPRDALRLTMASLPDGEDHLVLTVRTDRGDYVLDNLRAEPLPWQALPYRWLGQEVPRSGAWRAIAG
jgi:predicted transglutaminase-like cysteine proteinase